MVNQVAKILSGEEKEDKKNKIDLAPDKARDKLKSEIETAKKSEKSKNLKTIAEEVKSKLSEDANQIYKGLDATKSQLKDKEKIKEIEKLMVQFQKDFIGKNAKVLNELYKKELYDREKFKNYDVPLEKGEAKMDWETQLQFLERDLSVFIDKVFDEWSDAIAEVSHEDYENKEKSQHAFIDSILAMFEGFLPRSVLLDILKGLKDMTMFGAIFEGAYEKHAGLYVEEYFGLRKKLEKKYWRNSTFRVDFFREFIFKFREFFRRTIFQNPRRKFADRSFFALRIGRK
jgi:hypothetical protein